MDKKNVKVGIAPIGWTNDDMPDLGSENTFQQCVSEMALAGYKGTEIGNKYPTDPAELRKQLKMRGLQVANSWFSAFLTTAPYAEVEQAFRQKCAFLQAVGARRVGVSEQGHSIQGQKAPIFGGKHVMDEREWELLCTGLNRLGGVAQEYGITMTYHHHMGTVVETSAEVDRMMQNTDPDKVFLLYDSGHLAYRGEDYVAVLKKWVGRVRHVHLKDVRPAVVQQVKAQGLSFLEGVRMGAFTVPGDGAVDFPAIFAVLDEAGYTGWVLVEAEQDPAKANPLEYALKARKYIKKIARI